MEIRILFCKPCGFEIKAKQLMADIQAQFAGIINGVSLEPTNEIGNFEVYINEELVYSKIKKGHLPHPGEIKQEIMKKVVSVND